MNRLTNAILGIFAVTLYLLVAGEMADRDERFEEIARGELITETEKAVARISEGK